MANRHDLVITISKTAQVEIKINGIKGPECLKITEDIEKELGDIISKEKTSSFYEIETITDSDTKIKQ